MDSNVTLEFRGMHRGLPISIETKSDKEYYAIELVMDQLPFVIVNHQMRGSPGLYGNFDNISPLLSFGYGISISRKHFTFLTNNTT